MKVERAGFRMLRHEQLFQDPVADSYRATGRLREPGRCPDCGAVYQAGRWRWGVAAAGAHEERCPACHRIADRYPAGFVELAGPCSDAEWEDIARLARHREAAERAEHALERIMAIERDGDGLLITTTGVHLARRIAEAVREARHGTLIWHWHDAERLLRVQWAR